MQLGHVAVALTLSSFAPELTGGQVDAFSLESIAVTMAAHWLPNLDAIPIMLGWAKKDFHCTWTHCIFFALITGLITALFSIPWAILAVVSLLIHFLADMPSSVGLPLFMPLTRKRFTINLWADTGSHGWVSFSGTYKQSWTWILEGGAYLLLFVRLYQENVWPFI